MFTGIIEEVGVIRAVKMGEKCTLQIEAKKVLQETVLGDSIAVNGVCLTVAGFFDGGFFANVMNETLKMTNLLECSTGDKVHLERALTLSSRLGGHIVSGHIDGLAVVKSLKKDGSAVRVELQVEKEVLPYLCKKGSVALDGVSLTITKVEGQSLQVSLVEHTQEATGLTKAKVGKKLNLECDILAKYTKRLLEFKVEEEEGMVQRENKILNWL